MNVNRLARGHGEGVGPDGLDALLVGPGLDGLFDIGLDAGFQLGEQFVLLGDGQGQQAVEEPGHRRQVLLERAFPDQLQPGGVLEAVHGPARNVAAPQRDVELAQRHLGVGALQIVAGPEQGGVAAAHGGLRIALAPGDGAEAVETPGDGGDEAPLALHIRGDRAEQGGRGLVRPMGAAQPLDRLVGPPARLQQVMDTPRGIAAAEIGVIAAPGAAGHGEDEDAFIAGHEGGGLGEVGRGRAVAQRQAFAGCIGDAQAPGASGR